jgi:tRNA dimethylallyltransferase
MAGRRHARSASPNSTACFSVAAEDHQGIAESAPLVPVLAGPTASGKSVAAMRLADRFGLEIVSMDSAQVYQGMDIGTAKPSAVERARVPHHLLDLVPPSACYSAAQFVRDAEVAVRDVLARGRRPLVVGGTMLYYRALTAGLSDLPQADAQLRAELEQEGSRRGWPALHAELAGVDAASAARIQATDRQRIQRALEVWRLTGQPLSSLQGRRSVRAGLRFLPLLLVPQDRAALHSRIAQRFETMLRSGLVEELASLRKQHQLSAELPAMRAVGYRQAWQFLEGEIDARALREHGIQATRQLAKRQITWLRATAGEHFDAFGETLEALLEARLRP